MDGWFGDNKNADEMYMNNWGTENTYIFDDYDADSDEDKEVVLQAENLTKTFHNGSADVKVLKQCNIHFYRGEFTAIMGSAGAGKTTLLRILAGLDNPDTGIVTIEGKDVREMKDKEAAAFRRRNIGFVYQDKMLFPEFTAFENIIMPFSLDNKSVDEKFVNEVMEMLAIEDCRNKYPSQMTGWEQQKVAIARALVMHPAVIFADEPTENVDYENACNIAELLKLVSEKYNQTIIMATKDRKMAVYSDRVVSITDGVVSE